MERSNASDPALAWAEKSRFSALMSREAIDACYAAHLRILAKIAARSAE